MNEPDDALDRATEEALALLAADHAPPPEELSRPGSSNGGGYFPFADDPFADPAPGKTADHRPPGPADEGAREPTTARRTRCGWAAARDIAAGAAGFLGAERCALADALGRTLADPLTALTDLPSFDTSAMDGWALAGPGPWQLPAEEDGVFAGHTAPGPLGDGHAVRIATGARVPPGATAVLRSEHGTVTGRELHANRRVTQGQDIRPRAQECRMGDELLPAGSPVTPAVLGLAAAAGYDELRVTVRPRVELLVLGDELLPAGLPCDGRIRDALGPMFGPWLRALGAEVTLRGSLSDDSEVLYQALAASTADLVITTGGTAAGPRDHLHPALERLGAELLIDGVAVRPGHPMLLARLAPGRQLVGLPGNPLAAVAGLLTLAVPALYALSGRPVPSLERTVFAGPVPGHPADTRLVPVVRHAGAVRPLRFLGPAMLRGLAAADALAVIPPGGGAGHGSRTVLLELPWTTGVPE